MNKDDMEHHHPRELAPNPQGVLRGGLTVRRPSTEEPPPLEDGRPAYEPIGANGEKILSRAEVAALVEQEGELATINLFGADGQPRRTIRIQPEFATRFVQFDGRRYERIKDTDDWQDVGEEQPLKIQQ